ncbi:hypothetical protein FGO68_gene17617 [Halteria grandinella]|uniref:Uncharacterized protein n=1 Tax=Halteria grandinella TaxID=5974 RepID=A0A8J8TA31_HALGN|nr:hypothetical protein FGO68_gene17617 [Halteria grandinella]
MSQQLDRLMKISKNQVILNSQMITQLQMRVRLKIPYQKKNKKSIKSILLASNLTLILLEYLFKHCRQLKECYLQIKNQINRSQKPFLHKCKMLKAKLCTSM